MRTLFTMLGRLKRDSRGLAAMELGLALPVLTALGVGAIVGTRMVAQRIDYQQAAAEVASLALARAPASTGDTAYLKSAVVAASGLSGDKVTVSMTLTCDGTLSASSTCASSQEQARFVSLRLAGSYTPLWTAFGVGGPVPMVVTRTVRIQ